MQCDIDYFAFNPPKILMITQRRNQKKWRKHYQKIYHCERPLQPKKENQRQLEPVQWAPRLGATPERRNDHEYSILNGTAVVLLNRLPLRQEPNEGGDDCPTEQQPTEGGDTPNADLDPMPITRQGSNEGGDTTPTFQSPIYPPENTSPHDEDIEGGDEVVEERVGSESIGESTIWATMEIREQQSLPQENLWGAEQLTQIDPVDQQRNALPQQTSASRPPTPSAEQIIEQMRENENWSRELEQELLGEGSSSQVSLHPQPPKLSTKQKRNRKRDQRNSEALASATFWKEKRVEMVRNSVGETPTVAPNEENTAISHDQEIEEPVPRMTTGRQDYERFVDFPDNQNPPGLDLLEEEEHDDPREHAVIFYPFEIQQKGMHKLDYRYQLEMTLQQEGLVCIIPPYVEIMQGGISGVYAERQRRHEAYRPREPEPFGQPNGTPFATERLSDSFLRAIEGVDSDAPQLAFYPFEHQERIQSYGYRKRLEVELQKEGWECIFPPHMEVKQGGLFGVYAKRSPGTEERTFQQPIEAHGEYQMEEDEPEQPPNMPFGLVGSVARFHRALQEGHQSGSSLRVLGEPEVFPPDIRRKTETPNTPDRGEAYPFDNLDSRNLPMEAPESQGSQEPIAEAHDNGAPVETERVYVFCDDWICVGNQGISQLWNRAMRTARNICQQMNPQRPVNDFETELDNPDEPPDDVQQ